jgi:hypothetical protein
VKLDADDLRELQPLIAECVRATLQQIDADRDRIGYTEREAAEKLGIPKHVLADCRRRGEVKARRHGKQMIYSRQSLVNFVTVED